VWENHPEWLLGALVSFTTQKEDPNIRLLNLGNPEARRWLTDHVSALITKEGVDLYRQDHNVDPLPAWRGHDDPERQGMTENLYVAGYLAYWDALRQQHPGMLIDSCASGGRRNDLETLRRAVPLLRSDFMNGGSMTDPEIDSGNQCHTYGLSLWLPYYGTGVICVDGYSTRSHLCPEMVMVNYQGRWDVLRQEMANYRKVADYFYGDYYPLTAYSRGQDVWMAWEFVRPEQGDGMIQIFRRAESPYQTAQLKMQGLKSDARYTLTDIDSGKTIEESGKSLMEKGVPMEMPEPRSAKIITFQELR
jgi:alpha-galactosidase